MKVICFCKTVFYIKTTLNFDALLHLFHLLFYFSKIEGLKLHATAGFSWLKKHKAWRKYLFIGTKAKLINRINALK